MSKALLTCDCTDRNITETVISPQIWYSKCSIVTHFYFSQGFHDILLGVAESYSLIEAKLPQLYAPRSRQQQSWARITNRHSYTNTHKQGHTHGYGQHDQHRNLSTWAKVNTTNNVILVPQVLTVIVFLQLQLLKTLS